MLSDQPVRGAATISIVVDTESQVRVPNVAEEKEPEFGAAALRAALRAVRQWRFMPPQKDGGPIQVLAERRFRFGPAGETK